MTKFTVSCITLTKPTTVVRLWRQSTTPLKQFCAFCNMQKTLASLTTIWNEGVFCWQQHSCRLQATRRVPMSDSSSSTQQSAYTVKSKPLQNKSIVCTRSPVADYESRIRACQDIQSQNSALAVVKEGEAATLDDSGLECKRPHTQKRESITRPDYTLTRKRAVIVFGATSTLCNRLPLCTELTQRTPVSAQYVTCLW